MNKRLIPVIHSIVSGNALIETVLNNYPIGTRSCQIYKRGLNDTYLVATEQEIDILRVYRYGWRTKAEIDFELELLAFLHERQQPVAYPLKREDGSLTTEIAAPEGKRYTAVFSYAPGSAVNELNGRQSQNLGEVLANIYRSLDNFKSSFTKPALNSQYLLDQAIEAIAPLYQHRGSDIADLQKQIENIKTQLEVVQLPDAAPAYGICVGDVHAGNAHFTWEDKPTLFDFDQCGYGWRAFDIAKFMHTAYSRKLDATVSKLFLQGYQAVCSLNAAELAAIPIFVKVAHIWVMGISTSVVGDVLAYSWFTDDWLDSRLQTLKSLDDNYGE